MFRIALKMLAADRAKFVGLLFGIAFTSFLVTFAASYFCGFMTNGFALISENGATDVWVMDPAVQSVEQTINMPASALDRVRSVEGVSRAVPLALGNADVRFPNGQFQTFQVIGVDDASLAGAPVVPGRNPDELRARAAVIVDAGGTSGKLETPALPQDQWPHDGAHLDAPTRELRSGDELLVNEHLVRVLGQSSTLPRFPPRPLLYTTLSNALLILPVEPHTLTFVMARTVAGVSPREVAWRIELRTGLRAHYGGFQVRHGALVPGQLRGRRRHRGDAHAGDDYGLRRYRRHALHVHLRAPEPVRRAQGAGHAVGNVDRDGAGAGRDVRLAGHRHGPGAVRPRRGGCAAAGLPVPDDVVHPAGGAAGRRRGERGGRADQRAPGGEAATGGGVCRAVSCSRRVPEPRVPLVPAGFCD
nr:hypothetical protein [Rhodanobacter thiooxydans]